MTLSTLKSKCCLFLTTWIVIKNPQCQILIHRKSEIERNIILFFGLFCLSECLDFFFQYSGFLGLNSENCCKHFRVDYHHISSIRVLFGVSLSDRQMNPNSPAVQHQRELQHYTALNSSSKNKTKNSDSDKQKRIQIYF